MHAVNSKVPRKKIETMSLTYKLVEGKKYNDKKLLIQIFARQVKNEYREGMANINHKIRCWI